MQDVLHFQSLRLKTHVWFGHYQHAIDMLNGRNVVVVTDENLAKIYPSFINRFKHIVVPAGEQSKSFETLQFILSELMRLNTDRSTLILAFGGGVISDLVGFAASIFKRGVEFVLMPTSLLAMTDASVGGKNGINFNGYKNQIGCVRQPKFTWIDTQFLSSLPYLQFLNGLSELVKSCLIFPGKGWRYIQDYQEKLLKINPYYIRLLLTDAIQNKLQVVEIDEYDKGERQILNFGHSFGHAVESTDKMLHGLAVSKGMIAAIKLSVTMGKLSYNSGKDIVRVIENLGLPVNFEFKPEYFVYLEEDKKRLQDAINFICLCAPGEVEIKKISINQLKSLAYDARDISF